MRWYHWAAVYVAAYLVGSTVYETKRQAAEALDIAQGTAAKLEELRAECEP